MSELKHFLRKHEFPNCAREALANVEQLCCQTVVNLNQQRLIQDIMDEFIFCECDRRGLRKKRLNAIQELHLLDILCTYFEGQKNPIVANIVFLTLFHYQREPGASMYKMKVLTKLVSTAVATRSVGTLNCSAVWMQQQGCTSDVVVALARELIKDYLELFPRGTSDLQELPRISLHFSAHFITALTPMYGRLGDRVLAPPIELLKCIAHWITTYPHLCLTPLVTNLQGALPKGSIVMPACVPLPGLIRWCVEGPLIVGIGVDGLVTKRTDEGEDDVGGRSAVYSRLHLAVLESMMETRKLRDRMAQTDVISVRDLVSVCETVAASIKASVDIYVDSEERIRLALDRFGQALQISLTTGCLRGNLDELWSSFARLPSNRLIQMVIMSYSNQKPISRSRLQIYLLQRRTKLIPNRRRAILSFIAAAPAPVRYHEGNHKFRPSLAIGVTITACNHHLKSVCMIKKVPLCSTAAVQLRFLCPDDVEEIKLLCTDWFPVQYPDNWYRDIASNPRFYSLASVYDHAIIGLIVAEIKPRTKCNQEDQGILSAHFATNTQVAYILSLGVVQEFRRNGIASLLLDNLISHLTSVERGPCKALYLHVLTSNATAIRFYEQRYFIQHSYLPYYYSIQGKPRDGFSYVLYLNGGHPPLTVIDYIKKVARLIQNVEPCSFPLMVYSGVKRVVRRIWPGIGRMAHSTAALFS